MTARAVEFKHASKSYGSKLALDSLTLTINAGEIFALVGPNGAGKTTALGLITGLLTPSGGCVQVFGIDVETHPVEAKRLLGFVPDRPYLWPKWTPRETLRFIGTVFGARGPSLEMRIEEELDKFSLTTVANERNETLSHGTRQRVALAQAFLHSPQLYLLDEPMVGLDPIAQRKLVLRLREETTKGAAVLLTTHQLLLAEETGDRAGVLAMGKLLAWGQPKNLEGPSGSRGRLSEVFFDIAGLHSTQDGLPAELQS